VSQCSIYFPGLLGPDAPLEALDKTEWPGAQKSPLLSKLFTRGQVSALTKDDIETRVLNGLGVSFNTNKDAPIAYLRSQQIPHVTLQKKIWCLDPVFIQIDKEDAVICAHEAIGLTENEAQHFIEDLNIHFAEDGFKLHYHSAHHWLLEAELDLVTTSLSSAMHKNLSQLQPVGVTEKQWRTLQNEIQMLLYNHPENQARESRGDIPVNSLWLWGGGEPEQYERIVDTVFSDEAWISDVAQLYEIETHGVDTFSKLEDLDGACLLAYLDPLDAIRKNDAFAWLDSLGRFEEKIAPSIVNLLEKGKLDHVTVYSDTVSISLQKKDLKKWWKRDKPIRDSILKARSRYGF